MSILTVLTTDEETIELEESQWRYMKTLKNLREELGDMEEVIVVGCNSESMNCILEFIEEYQTMPIEGQNYLRTKDVKDILSIMQAANFLDFEECISECQAIMRPKLLELGPGDIRKEFTDTVPTETAYKEVQGKVQWYFDNKRLKSKKDIKDQE